MLTGVIGYGVVGKATAEVLRRLGHTVLVGDVALVALEAAQNDGYGCLKQGLSVDVLFLCVPENKLREALTSAPDCPVTVVRSTVPPGTTEALSAELGRPLAFMPEFLREATALWDELNPAFVLIGCQDEELGKTLLQLFNPLMAPIMLVPTSTAEMVKLTLNSYLYSLVSFWNEVHMICDAAGIQSHVVGKLCSQDPRVSTYGSTMHGKPVGGRCLPKDLAQLICFAQSKGCEPELLQAAQQVNGRLSHHKKKPVAVSQRPSDRARRHVLQGHGVSGGGANGRARGSHR